MVLGSAESQFSGVWERLMGNAVEPLVSLFVWEAHSLGAHSLPTSLETLLKWFHKLPEL